MAEGRIGLLAQGVHLMPGLKTNEREGTRAVLRHASVGLAESYVEGWWDTPALDQFLDRVLRVRLADVLRENWLLVAQAVRARILNLQSLTRSFDNGQHHYDIGNDLYEAMLGRRMAYTCAYWRDADDLDAAVTGELLAHKQAHRVRVIAVEQADHHGPQHAASSAVSLSQPPPPPWSAPAWE